MAKALRSKVGSSYTIDGRNLVLVPVYLRFIPVPEYGAWLAVQGILGDIDRQGTFEEEDFSCLFTIVSDKPGEQTNIQQARFFRRDRVMHKVRMKAAGLHVGRRSACVPYTRML